MKHAISLPASSGS